MTKEKPSSQQWDEGNLLRGTTQIPHGQNTADALWAGNGAEPSPSTETFKGKARKRMTRGFCGWLAANAFLSETIAFCGGVLRHSRGYYNTRIPVLQAFDLGSLLFVGSQNAVNAL